MKVFLIAGEPSGDKLGAALMEGLTELVPGVAFDGVGGPLMQVEGLTSRFPMEELSVMGLVEVLPRYFDLKRRIRQTAQAVIDTAPDVLITIDSPDFCLRVARLVREAAPAIPTVHYVAPSVWAWRPGRAARMARWIDHVLALLPFEPPYMQAAGMSCDFVGHPVVAERWAGPDQAAAFRAAHGIAPKAPLVMCLPGSRRGEVARLGPIFDETLMRLRDRLPEMRVVLPTVPGVAAMVREMAARWPSAPVVVETDTDRRAAFAAADLALAASGTVSLELAANRTPMVIAYDTSPLTRWLMTRMLRIDTVTLVNLVSESRAIPERLGRDCRPERILPPLIDLVDDADARAAQMAAMEITMQRLGEGGPAPGVRAAQSVLSFLANRQR